MSAYGFEREAHPLAAEAWRPLDHAVAHWVRVHGGSSLLAAVAAWASFADGQGDTALPLLGPHAGRHGMPLLTPEEVDMLRAQALVGSGDGVAPFVLNANGGFALWRNHAHEIAIAARLRERRALPPWGDAQGVVGDLDTVFQGNDAASVQRQRAAVNAVVGRHLFVLTGGPGTGKTTTVLRMLLMLQRCAPTSVSIQVVAPTGKAAQRLVQSLRQGKKALVDAAPAAFAREWHAYLQGIPDGEALTVHHLLGYDPRRNVFTRNRSRPVSADIVVVDEASMIDIATMHALLDAVRADATVILVGDADQLTSVAAGSILMDVVAALEEQGAEDLVRLEHSFRAERHLVPINDAIRDGDGVALRRAFTAAGDDATWRGIVDTSELSRRVREWAAALAQLALRPVLPAPQRLPVLADTVAADAATVESATTTDAAPEHVALAALHLLGSRQCLCALREDSFGALAVNAAIEAELKRRWGVSATALWYPGRTVIITRNDYSARLFNGDIGLCLMDAEGTLRVWFETTTPEGNPSARDVSPDALPAHEGAFAITVHKSQGSEYLHAAVLLPPDPAHRILSRQLLYTAVSRARRQLDLWALPDVVDAALANPVARVGGLAARLAMK